LPGYRILCAGAAVLDCASSSLRCICLLLLRTAEHGLKFLGRGGFWNWIFREAADFWELDGGWAQAGEDAFSLYRLASSPGHRTVFFCWRHVLHILPHLRLSHAGVHTLFVVPGSALLLR
jgi:hypothetical protein